MENYSLLGNTILTPYSEDVIRHCVPFTCGDIDMDDFFMNDASLYSRELLGKSYCFVTMEAPHQIVGMFTVANDSIKTTHLGHSTSNRVNRPIDNAKRGRSYPAILIGRIGVNSDFQTQGYHIGSQMIAFLKEWFTDEDNKAGCRFLVVDAYNKPNVLSFYERNGFKFLHKTEEEECEYYHIENDEIRTRLMYFDLKSK